MQTKTNNNRLLFATSAVTAWFFVCAAAPAHAVRLPAECHGETMAALSALDTDGDGLTDADETCVQFTDPAKADTDGDGHPDGEEVAGGFSPRYGDGKTLMQADSDEDYLIDAWELKLGTGLMDPDSDGDLYLDGTEVAASFDPLDPSPTARKEKLIHVEDKALRLTYSFGGVTLGVLPVSTGKTSTPTPHGDFEILAKVPVKHYGGPGYDYPNTKYNLQFTSKNGWRYYIHSAYWHNKFGKSPVSGGCVNVRLEDMEPLYWWAEYGTKVRVE
jgi:hypothetical protein